MIVFLSSNMFFNTVMYNFCPDLIIAKKIIMMANKLHNIL